MATVSCLPASQHCARLHLLQDLLVDTGSLILGLPEAFSSGWTCPIPVVSLHRVRAPVPSPPWKSSHSLHVLSCIGSSRLHAHDLTTAAQKGIITSLNHLDMLLLIQPRILLAFAARTHCSFMFSCCLPKPYQQGCYPASYCPARVAVAKGSSFPGAGLGICLWLSVNLNFTRFPLSLSSNLFKCLWMAVLT